MATAEQIRAAIEQLNPDADVELELSDGSKVAGRVATVEDGELQVEDVAGDGLVAISADDVVDVIQIISGEGIE